VIAAFGNVHWAELLFMLRIDPDRAAGTVDRATSTSSGASCAAC